jgi:thrombospondin type-1 domain-containing protein 4
LNYKLKAANSLNSTTPTTGRKKRKFTWKVIGFTPCSKTCGGGSQQPIIRCVRGMESTKAYSPKKCAHLKKPDINEKLMKCNSQPCPAFWKLGDFSSCQCGEFDEKTNQSREVKCVQELISGVVIQVNSGACIEDRPVTTLSCECIKPVKTSKIEVYKHSRLQPSITQNTQSDQKLAKNRTKQPKNKKSGTWLISEW